jgi:segregation and condensation protein B
MFHHPLVQNAPLRTSRRGLPVNRRLSSIYRLELESGPAKPLGPGARDAALAVLEALLLAADEPLPTRKLAALAGLSDGVEARRLVEKLRSFHEADGSAFTIEELAGGYQLLTRPEFHPWLTRLRRPGGDLRLSPAARETLTIVAYRQPITRADLENVRGVQSGEVLRQLMEKGLVRIAGRDDSLGRPVLYGTTKKFLQVYGLRSLRDLPPVEEMNRGPAGPQAGE